ncbi:sensor histidine kinase [Amycolatopsis sp. Hca4]|uniref:sensor histidine kinase n=1 Tax=Amycolatopsis sp. Hca4 TaxID=2742131 RepID=UPI0015907FD4|nr:sensor histidine kinase [Amycolatopsis sp. Hca4]QKV74637.1 sensor histidine kinase [Amycolatopsis sp. Hca4]
MVTRIVPWVSGAVYGIVLLAGVYSAVAGLGPANGVRLAGFVAGIGALFALDAVERRVARWPAAFLAARLVLFFAVAALDGSGLARALFVLVPFAAYLTFGRPAGLVLGGLCLAVLVGGFAVWVPGWYRDTESVSDVLMFATGLVLALAMADVAVRERRAASRVAELSAAAERNRLARDIHDSLGHHLTAVSIQLEKAAAFAGRDSGVAGQALADARRSVGYALEDVRTSVGTLRGGGRSLAAVLGELGVPLDVHGEEPDLGPATVTTLHRAAQEAVTNARRHGRADHVRVSVTFGAATRLVVTDNGRGFDPGAARSGYGLLGLRERAALVGGTVSVDSEPGAGTRVTVTVP